MTTVDKSGLINMILETQKRIGHWSKSDVPAPWLALNLTIPQLKSMMFINFKGVTNFKTLAEALGVTPPNVTGIVDRLVDQGLVTRESNLQNRRTQMLKLTEKGNTLLTELRERSTAQLSGILEKLSIEDLSALAQGLNALASVIEKGKGNITERVAKK